jgi:UDP-3-O-[3-hydroxymyristoyl] glucosamine N-acyltransferase
MIEIEDLLKDVDYQSVTGSRTRVIANVLPLHSIEHSESSITWVSESNLEKLMNVRLGAVVCPVGTSPIHSDVTYIMVQNPRLVFSNIQKILFPNKRKEMISSSAHLAKNIHVGMGVCIEHNVVIEEDCIIGDNTYIGANTVIRSSTKIGKNVTIGCNCSIGNLGFGYELNEQGVHERIKHTGNVVIGDYVEIGNNTCIDRAVLGSTQIAEYCKIDNLVHIAHGVHIGRNSIVIANSMIAGSVVLGENVWVAPSVSVLNKLTVADHAYIGMGAVIIRNVESGDMLVGNPGRVIKKASTPKS